MCTVLLRFRPGAPWPLLLGAVRDEMLDRAWDAPAAHWPEQPCVQGGRDRLSGGTWLAFDRARGVVTAVLNGIRREPDDRPSRGGLPLAALTLDEPVTDASVRPYDGFHLLRADRSQVEMWSWDGATLDRRRLHPGDHIIVNLGADRPEDPLVPHFTPLLAAVPEVTPDAGQPPTEAWGGWLDLMAGDSLDPSDPRALLIEHRVNDVRYGSGSASLVAVSADGATRYDFTATPRTPHWAEVACHDVSECQISPE